MKVSIDWLKEYIALDTPPKRVAELLTMIGFAVERIEGDVLEFDVTSNRPDCLGIIGVARELAAAIGQPLRLPLATALPAPESADVRVEIEDLALCPRYIAQTFRNVKVGPSPAWMQKRLESLGLRPINNIVDITNYVMLESGHPLHAFDAKFMRGRRVVVRPSRTGEKIQAIDAKTYELSTSMLVIADAERPQAIAGIMGGKESEITEATADVILESALFDPIAIRLTSKTLGLSSESSYRFERQADYVNVEWASHRAARLIVELAGGRPAGKSVDVGSAEPEAVRFKFRPQHVRRVLGYDVVPDRAQKILRALGFQVDGAFTVTVPHWRRDVRLEEDLVEEIARIEGYDKVPVDAPLIAVNARPRKIDQVRTIVRTFLFGAQYYEALTSSFIEPKLADEFGYWSSDPAISLKSGDGKTTALMRRSLVAMLLDTVRINESYKDPLVPLFELAKIYFARNSERLCLAGVDVQGYRRLKGTLEGLFDELQIAASFARADVPSLAPGKSCVLRVGTQSIGYCGIVDPRTLRVCDVASADVACFELDFEALAEAASLEKKFKPPARFLPIRRDLAIVLDRAVEWETLSACVRRTMPSMLDRLELFDIYQGKGIPDGKKSVAFSLYFAPADRTPRAEEIDAVVNGIVGRIEQELGGKLRGTQ